MLKKLSICLVALLAVFAFSAAPAAADNDKLKPEELDQLLAPIALYPDELLTNVLMASTYPLDIVAAERWRRNPANAKLEGNALEKALEAKEWDPSIKALVQFPDVLKTMSDQLEWTQKLGDAFLAQQDDVMNEIQLLRRKADEAGHLKSSAQQKVTKESSSDAEPVYIIEPATPERVYVPVYQPAVVYGSWWYPDYPPYYWSYPDARFVDGFFWGAGVAIAAGIWGWNHCDWHHHDINIDVDKWNRIDVNRNKIANNTWKHRPEHRGPVPYRSKDAREKFAHGDRRPSNADFRGRDVDRAKIEARLKDSNHSQIRDKIGDRDAPARHDRSGDKIRDKTGPAQKAHDRRDKGGAKKIGRDSNRPKARKAPPAAFDVKRGADVRKFANRGHASRVSMASRGGGRAHRGGGHRGGGRRR